MLMRQYIRNILFMWAVFVGFCIIPKNESYFNRCQDEYLSSAMFFVRQARAKVAFHACMV